MSIMADEKQYRTPTVHGTEIIINNSKLKEVIDRRGMTFTELHDKMQRKYGLDLGYKGFMSLLKNRSTWKLLYAHAMSDILLINYTEIFDVVDVDVEKVKRQKEEWKEKYQKEE